jgi:acyl-CoA synthetase (AMP-forming)/AMP-acid ligase II
VDLWSMLEHAAASTPDAAALIRDRVLGYGEARALAARLGAAMQRRGIAPGDRVAVLSPNTPGFFLAYFAADGCGAILVPLNTRLHDDEQRDILRDSGTLLLLCDPALASLAGRIAQPLSLDVCSIDALCAQPPAAPFRPAPGDASAVAHLYYTSGTTGRPKGVMLTHRNVVAHAHAAIGELGLTSADRWAHIAPMFHLADAWATFAVTAAGGAHVFLEHFTAAAALDLLERERITITNLVPTMLNLMVNEPTAGSRRYVLRAMLSGGAPIAPSLVRRILAVFRCEYVQTYGMTETSPYLTLGLLHPHLRALPEEQRLHYVCKTGRPFRGVTLEVIGADGRPVPPDGTTVGEIRVRGETVTPGYWQNPEATAQAFDADGFLRTGDLATIDAEGYVDIVDRKKDVIKTGGEAVYSVEVENVLHRHPAVLECAVFGTPHPLWGEAVTAAVVLRQAATATAQELIDWCRDRIAHYKSPSQVRFLPELPKTGTGKISKRLLRGAQ